MRRASAAARKKMLGVRRQQCAAQNGPLLDELLALRHQAARCLGYACHADRMLASKMAGSTQAATQFVHDMLQRMAGLRDTEMKRLQARKEAYCKTSDDGNDGDGEELHAWDVAFFSDMLKREELDFDDEKVKVSEVDTLLILYFFFVHFPPPDVQSATLHLPCRSSFLCARRSRASCPSTLHFLTSTSRTSRPPPTLGIMRWSCTKCDGRATTRWRDISTWTNFPARENSVTK